MVNRSDSDNNFFPFEFPVVRLPSVEPKHEIFLGAQSAFARPCPRRMCKDGGAASGTEFNPHLTTISSICRFVFTKIDASDILEWLVSFTSVIRTFLKIIDRDVRIL